MKNGQFKQMITKWGYITPNLTLGDLAIIKYIGDMNKKMVSIIEKDLFDFLNISQKAGNVRLHILGDGRKSRSSRAMKIIALHIDNEDKRCRYLSLTPFGQNIYNDFFGRDK